MEQIRCNDCGQAFDPDDMHIDDAGEVCLECYDKWFEAEVGYWKPLYDGEVSAGLAGLSKDESPYPLERTLLPEKVRT